MADDTCCIDGCDKPRYQQRRMCSTHVMRKHRYGDPLIDKTRAGRTWQADTGYLKRTIPDHPLADAKGAVYVHRVVLYEAIGPGEHPCHWCSGLVSWDKHYPQDQDALVPDHLDGDKLNNDPANLVPTHNGCNSRRFSTGRKRGSSWEWLD